LHSVAGRDVGRVFAPVTIFFLNAYTRAWRADAALVSRIILGAGIFR
jgi:hypothetical protein